MMKKGIAILVVSAVVCGLSAGAGAADGGVLPAQEPSALAVYNFLTGEVFIDVEEVTNWTLQGDMTGPVAALDTLPLAGGFVTGSDTVIGEGTITTPFSYEADLGAVAATDLTADDLVLRYDVGLGQPTLDGVVQIVPEPATLALLGLGGLACLRRRK